MEEAAPQSEAPELTEKDRRVYRVCFYLFVSYGLGITAIASVFYFFWNNPVLLIVMATTGAIAVIPGFSFLYLAKDVTKTHLPILVFLVLILVMAFLGVFLRIVV